MIGKLTARKRNRAHQSLDENKCVNLNCTCSQYYTIFCSHALLKRQYQKINTAPIIRAMKMQQGDMTCAHSERFEIFTLFSAATGYIYSTSANCRTIELIVGRAAWRHTRSTRSYLVRWWHRVLSNPNLLSKTEFSPQGYTYIRWLMRCGLWPQR